MEEYNLNRRINVAPASGEIMTVAELAKFLDVHPTTIYRLLRTGKLPAFRVGSEWRFSTDSIAKWIKDNEQVPQPLRRRRK